MKERDNETYILADIERRLTCKAWNTRGESECKGMKWMGIRTDGGVGGT